MKITLKPIKFVDRSIDMSPLAVIVMVPRDKKAAVARSYEQLVTYQGLDPDRAKSLLGIS